MKKVLRSVDETRQSLWMFHLRQTTGLTRSIDLARRLDPSSIWVDAFGTERERKWSDYDAHRHSPSRQLAERVAVTSGAPAFEYHHPVWYLLRNPDLPASSLRRLQSQMPAGWRLRLQLLDNAGLQSLRIGAGLCKLATLWELSFLDAVFLFESARRRAQACGLNAREDALICVLIGLPFLYCHASPWRELGALESSTQRELALKLLSALGDGLQLGGVSARGISFPIKQRLYALEAQWHELDNYRKANPRSLRTEAAKMKFLERGLDSVMFGAAIAKSAWRAGPPRGRVEERSPPVSERLWRTCWTIIEEYSWKAVPVLSFDLQKGELS